MNKYILQFEDLVYGAFIEAKKINNKLSILPYHVIESYGKLISDHSIIIEYNRYITDDFYKNNREFIEYDHHNIKYLGSLDSLYDHQGFIPLDLLLIMISSKVIYPIKSYIISEGES
jgi:hypothetical protein